MKLTGKTQVFGIIGNPVSHSASPLMHNLAYERLGLDCVYVPFPVYQSDDLNAVLLGVRALSIQGLNVTVPYKSDVVPFLDELDPFAHSVGAVNTIVNQSGRLMGYNTDGDGFILSLKEELSVEVKGMHVVIVGAGGSTRSIVGTLIRSGCARISILNRTLNRAQELLHLFSDYGETLMDVVDGTKSGWDTVLSQSDMVVNTTSVGMAATLNDVALPHMEWVHAHQICYDVIYAPAKTRFLKEAEQRGARICNGAGMLAGQGILSFRYFTGKEVPYLWFKDAIPIN